MPDALDRLKAALADRYTIEGELGALRQPLRQVERPTLGFSML